MNQKPDFEKASIDHVISLYGSFGRYDQPDKMRKESFLAGCEHAYSIDKETIERLEKENKAMLETLNLAQAELRAAYKRLGYINSNVLTAIDKHLESNPDN